MTCDLCGKNEATVHLTEIINEQTRELHLCEPCAHEKGTEAAENFGLAGLLAGLTDSGSKPEAAAARKQACPRCGMTYEDFRKTGRLGCGACYETFHRLLAPLLKRVHGSTQHVGKTPAAAATDPGRSKEEELARLKDLLKQAVAAEEFEEAARLRDQIRVLKPTRKKTKGGKK